MIESATATLVDFLSSRIPRRGLWHSACDEGVAHMPSMAHEILVDLFKTRPALAAELLVEVLGVALPRYTEARLTSADLTEIDAVDPGAR